MEKLRLFVVRFADGSEYPDTFASKTDAKEVRDRYADRKARVSRGPDHWRVSP